MNYLTQKPIAIAIALALGVSLSGCGSDSSTATAIETETGTFVDSAVDGLTYKGAVNGKTSNGGKYEFVPGGQVSFYVGDKIKLGQLLARTTDVSPADFFETTNLSNQQLRNILVLLQSLDSDGDRSNGITITDEAIALLEELMADSGLNVENMDLSKLSEEEALSFKTLLQTILASVVSETESPDDEVVDEEEAVDHFTEVMSGDITIHKNISRTPEAGSGGQGIQSMMLQTATYSTTGEVDETTLVRPLLVSYTDIVDGDFLMGTGSSEIPDIEHVSDVFMALSLDKGESWKSINVSNTGDDSSIEVDFWGDGQKVPYYGYSFKPAMKTEGNKVLVAWQDKFCPSGNPSGFTATGDGDSNTYPDDLYLVNGPQGTINYEGIETYEGEVVPAHEVPFSCIWTARGVLNEEEHTIDWYAPEQLTSGRRDANKVTIASDTTGFVLAWQEDPTGLRPGSGSGPGEGWSGASTNHRTDMWYSYIQMEQFTAIDTDAQAGGTPTTEDDLKPKALYKLASPVPVTDNAVCKAENVESGTGALYCADLCTNNGTFTAAEGEDDRDNGKCYSNYIDPIRAIYNDTPDVIEQQLLNGDTGASRPILGLFGTKVIFGYEETKGEAVSLPGVPNSETLDTIATEDQGKIAYVHSFEMTDPEVIAPGTIVNDLRIPEAATEDNPNRLPVLENVRRLTLISQVDSKDVTNESTQHRWGILYKSGILTQGESSDMYLRLAKGGYDVSNLNTAEDMAEIMGTETWPSNSWNVSARNADEDEKVRGTWTPDNLADSTWENNFENTFSPRGYLSGDTIFIGYEYTPSWRVAQVGHLSNNFNVIRSDDNGTNWIDPIDVTNISNNIISTVDPRLIPTSEAIPGVETRDPNTVFVTYGTLEMGSGLELDLFVTRSTDGGDTWEKVPANVDGSLTNEAIVQSEAEEKEIQGIASPDGKTLYSLWLQELDPEEASADAPDYLIGSDIWAQRKDYTEASEEETVTE